MTTWVKLKATKFAGSIVTVMWHLFKKKKKGEKLISYHAFAGSQTGSSYCCEEQNAGSHDPQLYVRVEFKSCLLLCGAIREVTVALFTAPHVCKNVDAPPCLPPRDSHVTECQPANCGVPNTARFNPARQVHCMFTFEITGKTDKNRKIKAWEATSKPLRCHADSLSFSP